MVGTRTPTPEIGEMVRQLAYQLHADDAKLLADATTPRNSAP